MSVATAARVSSPFARRMGAWPCRQPRADAFSPFEWMPPAPVSVIDVARKTGRQQRARAATRENADVRAIDAGRAGSALRILRARHRCAQSRGAGGLLQRQAAHDADQLWRGLGERYRGAGVWPTFR